MLKKMWRAWDRPC